MARKDGFDNVLFRLKFYFRETKYSPTQWFWKNYCVLMVNYCKWVLPDKIPGVLDHRRQLLGSFIPLLIKHFQYRIVSQY